jgi:structural maintenance of chromosome 4
MKPKGQGENEDGLLEYLEDIIGTTGYKARILEAEKSLEELGTHREEKLSHLKLIQKETKNLKSQSEEAVKFIQGENDIARLENQNYQKQGKELQSSIETLSAEKVWLE